MATSIPKSDVPVEKVEMNAEYGLSPNRTFDVPYLTNPFKEWERMTTSLALNLWNSCQDGSVLERRKFMQECETTFTDGLDQLIPNWAAKEAVSEILVYLDIENLRKKVIPGRDINRYFNVGYMHPSERYRFTMTCVHCHQTSSISYAVLCNHSKLIDMYQKLRTRFGYFPYHRYPFVKCPKCKKVILFPGWMQLIDRVKYVPTLLEGALEIGWMDMRNTYEEYEDRYDQPGDEDNALIYFTSVALNESYPHCWFPYTNKYLRELKIEYIRIGERRININDYHRLFTRVFDDIHGSGSGTVRRSSLPSRRRKR